MSEFSTTLAMALLQGVSDNCSAKELDACLKQCADCHYEACGCDKMAAQFAGDLDGFVRLFNERMFSEVLQRPANTKLLCSWLLDGTSCLYEITI